MGLGIETFGNYDVKPLSDGKYSVTCNNGNIGACVVDEEGLKKFKEKYSKDSDTFELSSKESKTPKMSYEEANAIASMLVIPGANFFAMINPKTKEALEALEYYRNEDVPKKSNVGASHSEKLNSNAPKMSYKEANAIASMLVVPGANFFAITNPKTKEAMEALEYYRNNNIYE